MERIRIGLGTNKLRLDGGRVSNRPAWKFSTAQRGRKARLHMIVISNLLQAGAALLRFRQVRSKLS
jgi:hypothetical protein